MTPALTSSMAAPAGCRIPAPSRGTLPGSAKPARASRLQAHTWAGPLLALFAPALALGAILLRPLGSSRRYAPRAPWMRQALQQQ
jgi:hypothetical protein